MHYHSPAPVVDNSANDSALPPGSDGRYHYRPRGSPHHLHQAVLALPPLGRTVASSTRTSLNREASSLAMRFLRFLRKKITWSHHLALLLMLHPGEIEATHEMPATRFLRKKVTHRPPRSSFDTASPMRSRQRTKPASPCPLSARGNTP
jgi:hypothetical protein